MGWWDMMTYPFRRPPRVPLAQRRPARAAKADTPLGMEATDLDAIAKASRRNDALERVALFSLRARPDTTHRASHVPPMPEDETYAARYARAFLKKGR